MTAARCARSGAVAPAPPRLVIRRYRCPVRAGGDAGSGRCALAAAARHRRCLAGLGLGAAAGRRSRLLVVAAALAVVVAVDGDPASCGARAGRAPRAAWRWSGRLRRRRPGGAAGTGWAPPISRRQYLPFMHRWSAAYVRLAYTGAGGGSAAEPGVSGRRRPCCCSCGAAEPRLPPNSRRGARGRPPAGCSPRSRWRPGRRGRYLLPVLALGAARPAAGRRRYLPEAAAGRSAVTGARRGGPQHRPLARARSPGRPGRSGQATRSQPFGRGLGPGFYAPAPARPAGAFRPALPPAPRPPPRRAARPRVAASSPSAPRPRCCSAALAPDVLITTSATPSAARPPSPPPAPLARPWAQPASRDTRALA